MRTIRNKIIMFGNYAAMCLYDKDGNEIAKTIIDKESIPLLAPYVWSVMKGGSKTKTYRVRSRVNNKAMFMHQLILGKKYGYVIDHINQNGLDNRKYNLRFCTTQENNRNTSLTKGVCWDEKNGKWRATIMVNRKSVNLGRFPKIKEAQDVRIKAEKKYFGKFAPNRSIKRSTLIVNK